MGKRHRKYPSTLSPLLIILRNEIQNLRITIISHSDPAIAALETVTVLYETMRMFAICIEQVPTRELLIEKRSGVFKFTVHQQYYIVPGEYLLGTVHMRQKRKWHVW